MAWQRTQRLSSISVNRFSLLLFAPLQTTTYMIQVAPSFLLIILRYMTREDCYVSHQSRISSPLPFTSVHGEDNKPSLVPLSRSAHANLALDHRLAAGVTLGTYRLALSCHVAKSLCMPQSTNHTLRGRDNSCGLSGVTHSKRTCCDCVWLASNGRASRVH